MPPNELHANPIQNGCIAADGKSKLGGRYRTARDQERCALRERGQKREGQFVIQRRSGVRPEGLLEDCDQLWPWNPVQQGNDDKRPTAK